MKKLIIMKKLFAYVMVLVSLFGFSQSQNDEQNVLKNDNIEFQNLDMIITVDSLEELEPELNVSDLKDLFEEIKAFKRVSFQLVCNDMRTSNVYKKNMSVKIESPIENEALFLKRVRNLKAMAITYYQNNN